MLTASKKIIISGNNDPFTTIGLSTQNSTKISKQLSNRLYPLFPNRYSSMQDRSKTAQIKNYHPLLIVALTT